MIAIVLPFFQDKPGLLLRAVQSVLAQRTARPWHLFVVDDGSPIDAAEELAPLEPSLRGRWTLLRQRNGGASAARNRALDELTEAHAIVAFLDSDDIWRDGHLERLGAAFDAGADFYFENYARYDARGDHFVDCGLTAGPEAEFDRAHRLYWFEGDFFDALLRRSPAGTPTVAYRFSKAPHLRFRTDLSFCEDIFFWMQFTRSAEKIAFSPVEGVFCGKGVNLSEAGWGTFRMARKLASQVRYQQLAGEEFPLNPIQKAWNEQVLRRLDIDFWEAVLAAALRREPSCGALSRSYLRLRPGAITRLPAALHKAVQGKFFKSRRCLPAGP
jgi:glycosyltransferase involved in cell wall biosynthesis